MTAAFPRVGAHAARNCGDPRSSVHPVVDRDVQVASHTFVHTVGMREEVFADPGPWDGTSIHLTGEFDPTGTPSPSASGRATGATSRGSTDRLSATTRLSTRSRLGCGQLVRVGETMWSTAGGYPVPPAGRHALRNADGVCARFANLRPPYRIVSSGRDQSRGALPGIRGRRRSDRYCPRAVVLGDGHGGRAPAVDEAAAEVRAANAPPMAAAGGSRRDGDPATASSRAPWHVIS